MAAISCFSAPLTSRCRASSVFFSNSGDTITAVNAWPQPPDMSWMETWVVCRDSRSLLVRDSGVIIVSSAVEVDMVLVVGMGMAVAGDEVRGVVLMDLCWWKSVVLVLDIDADPDVIVG